MISTLTKRVRPLRLFSKQSVSSKRSLLLRRNYTESTQNNVEETIEDDDIEEKTSPISLSGIYSSIPTPFRAGGEVSHDDLAYNIELLADSPLSGLCVLGKHSEASSLSYKEKVEILNTIKKVAHPKMQLFAGTGCNGIQETIELTLEAQSLGYDSAIIPPPFRNIKLSDSALESYFIKIADEVEIPIILYNKPNGILLQPHLVKKIAHHPNIAGIIEGGSLENLAALYAETKAVNFSVLGDSGGTALLALLSGAEGIVSGSANILPNDLYEIYELYTKKNYTEAEARHREFVQFDYGVSRFGVQGLKYVMSKKGFQCEHSRLPLLPLNEYEKLSLDNLIRQYKL